MKLKSTLKYASVPAKIFTTVLILLLGILFLQVVITQVVLVFAYRIGIEQASLAEEPLWRIPRSSKNFLPDGTIHLVHVVRDKYRGVDEDYRLEQIYDVNDTLLWEGIHKDRPYEYLSWAKNLGSSFSDNQMMHMQRITPEFSKALEIPVNSQKRTELVWRYEPAADLFVGYRIQGEKIGYIGSTGFTDSKQQAKPFGRFKLFTAWTPQDSLTPTLLWQTEHRIYQINFEKQLVDVLFESLEATIKQVVMHTRKSSDELEVSKIEYRPTIHCITEDNKHHLIMRNPAQQLTIIAPDNLDSDFIGFLVTKEQVFLHYHGRDSRLPDRFSISSTAWEKWLLEYSSKPHKDWVELYQVSNEGVLDLVNRFDWVRPANPITERYDSWQVTRRQVRKVSPPAYDWAWHLLDIRSWLYRYHRNSFTRDFAEMIREFRPGDSILNLVLSAAMVAFAFWHGRPRRTSWAKFIFWLIFVGVFNLAGLLTYLALNHTAVIKCAVCGRRRGLEQVDCVRCGKQLPAPQPGKLDLIFNV